MMREGKFPFNIQGELGGVEPKTDGKILCNGIMFACLFMVWLKE